MSATDSPRNAHEGASPHRPAEPAARPPELEPPAAPPAPPELERGLEDRRPGFPPAAAGAWR